MGGILKAIAFAAIAMLLSPFSRTQEKTFEIRGTVVLGDSPLWNVEVSLRPKGGTDVLKTATDLDGVFTFHDVPPGQYRLRAGDPGVVVPQAPSRSVDLNVDRRLSLIVPVDFRCAPSSYFLSRDPSADQLATLQGHVTNESRDPIGDAAVALYVPSQGRIATTHTDADGQFFFSRLPVRKDYWVQVLGDGYFAGEFTKLDVRPGYQSIYDGLILESCEPGHCEPYLRKVQIPNCEYR